MSILDAVQRGDAAEVSRLLANDRSLLQARNSDGVSAILLGMYHGHLEVAELFRAQGAQLDIFEASATGAKDRIEELLAQDFAAANAFSSDGFTPLALASFFGHFEAVGALLRNGAEVNRQARNQMKVAPLHAAAARRDARIVQVLLEAGADPNLRQQAGYTPIHTAAMNGDPAIAELLLAHGARPDLQAEDGRDAAAMANQGGHAELAKRLSLH